MQIRYYKEYSNYLNRDMEFKVFGHAGRPILIFPCQSGRFFDWENNGMCSIAAPWIDAGKLQIFCADSIDRESWDNNGPGRPRIEMQERYYNYVTGELTPRLLEINREQGADHTGRVLTGGASVGAFHAVNFFLRRPDLYNGTIALSGIYTNERSFGCYHDDLTYNNAPLQYLGGMPCGHPYIEKYNRSRIVLCVGRGAWEVETLEDTRAMAAIFRRKGIDAWVDFWGDDVCHDWNWWYLQAAYFLPLILG